MATVGQQLLEPEQGWQRIDDTNSKIIYIGNWYKYGPANANVDSVKCYNYTFASSSQYGSRYNQNGLEKIKLKFYGTKIRLLGIIWSYAFSNNCYIKIDDTIYNYTQKGTNIGWQTLMFEKLDLPLKLHTVEIGNSSTTEQMAIDAIDIDDTGYIVNPVPVVKLLVQDGSLLKTISSGNLVTVCNTTDSDTIIENAFNTSGLNDLSLWNDTLTNQIVNSTFNIVAYRKYVE